MAKYCSVFLKSGSFFKTLIFLEHGENKLAPCVAYKHINVLLCQHFNSYTRCFFYYVHNKRKSSNNYYAYIFNGVMFKKVQNRVTPFEKSCKSDESSFSGPK